MCDSKHGHTGLYLVTINQNLKPTTRRTCATLQMHWTLTTLSGTELTNLGIETIIHAMQHNEMHKNDRIS